jgi:hypothetical protein
MSGTDAVGTTKRRGTGVLRSRPGSPGRVGSTAVFALLGVCGATLLTSGCSSSGVPVAADPAAAVSDAVAAAAKIHSAQVETSTTMAVDGASEVFTGSGAFDFDTEIGYISLAEPKATTPLEEIITPSVLYMRDQIQTGKSTDAASAKWRWVNATQLPDGDLISAGCTSPVFDFALLRGVSAATVKYVGQSTVNGTAVAHYTGTLDLASAAGQAAEPIKSELLAAAHSFSQQDVAFDAYLDAQGELRRVTAHFSFPAAAPAHGQVAITAITDLFSLNAPVTVAAPGAADLASPMPAAASPAASSSAGAERSPADSASASGAPAKSSALANPRSSN